MERKIGTLTARRGLSALAVGVAFCLGQVGLAQSQDDATGEPQSTTHAEQTPPIEPASQPPPDSDATGSAATTVASPGRDEVPAAVVIEVAGSVEWAAPGVSVVSAEGWTIVALGDRLEPGTQIRTGLRSHVNLRFGRNTVVSVRSATHASVDQFYRSATAQSVRLGLAYGTIRGGSTEGEVRSDLTVESTVAALVKRGTEGWEMRVEPVTGRFRISLSEYGLVEAIRKLRGGKRVSRSVRPGEYATDANIANLWIKQDIFNRNVTFHSPEVLTLSDAEFTAYNTRGYAVLAPGGGSALADLSARVNADFVLDQIAANAPPSTPPPTMAILEPLPVSRPEGNFGTGGIFRVLVPASSVRRR